MIYLRSYLYIGAQVGSREQYSDAMHILEVDKISSGLCSRSADFQADLFVIDLVMGDIMTDLGYNIINICEHVRHLGS